MSDRIRVLCVLFLLVAGSPGLAYPASEAPDDNEEGFVPVFGDTWMIVGDTPETWTVNKDGTIVSHGTGNGWLLSTKEYSDFELRLEIKMSKGADTGITFRTSSDVAPTAGVTQVQFRDDDLPGRTLDRSGALWDIAPPASEGATKPIGEWNEVQLLAKGSKLIARINGQVVTDLDLNDYKHRTTEQDGGASAHPDLLRAKGRVGLEHYRSDRIEFRKVRIKELDERG